MMKLNSFKLAFGHKARLISILILGSLIYFYVSEEKSMGQVNQFTDVQKPAQLIPRENFTPHPTHPHPISTVPAGPRFRPRSDTPYPEDTESSGVRNDGLCAQDAPSSSSEQMMKAVAPEGKLKLTDSGRPTFWVAVPQTEATQVILSVETLNPDQTKTLFSQQRYAIAQTPALVGLPLPDNAPELTVNASYQWSVVLLCGDTPHPSDPHVFSTVKRVPASNLIDTQTATIQNASALSLDGFWYDPVTMLLNRYQQNPQNQTLIQHWQALMNSAGLETISEQYGPNKILMASP